MQSRQALPGLTY